MSNSSRPEAWSLYRQLAEKFPIIVADQAGDTWANDTGIAAIAGCRTAIQAASSPVQAASGKVFLIGVSMGFTVACAWARANIGQVAGIAGILPLVNMTNIYDRDYEGAKAVIDAAYGGTYSSTTDGPTHDPIQFAQELNVPIKLWYASNDPGVLPATVTSFVAAAPNCTKVSLGAIGHDTEASYPIALNNGLIEFISANMG
jgi:pimeloyl-ACP methyl ester carboxylesterase